MNPPDDFDEPPSRKGLYLGVALTVTLLLLAFGFFFGRPSYRALKTFRAQQLAHQAEKYAGEQKWREALQTAQAAYQMASTDAKTLRILARLQARMSPPDALELYLALVQLPEARPDDQRELTRLAIALGKIQLAQSTLNTLLQNEPANVNNLLLASDLALASRDINGAITYANRARSLDPHNRVTLFTLGRLFALNSKTHAEAAKILLQLAIPSTDQIGLDSLQILAKLTDLPEEDARLAADALQRHPLSRLPQKLLALQVDMRLKPSERNAMLDAAIQQYSDTEDNKLILARWLNQQKEYQRVITLIPDKLLFLSQNLFLVRVDAMASLKQWQEIDALLTNPRVPLSTPIRELYRARCARELGQKAESEARWNRAIAEAATDSNPNTLWYLADYALRINERAQAWKIFDRLAQNPITARRAYENLVRMAEQEGETVRLLEIITRAAKSYPEDPAPRNDITYLQLLLNQHTDQAQINAEQLFAEQPRIVAFRVTLALAKLKANQPAQALQLFQGISFTPSDLLPGWQAIYATTLARNNRLAEAKQIAAKIPLERLKPQERELIQGLR